MIKLFASLIGLAFAISCLTLFEIQKFWLIIYEQNRGGEVLPRISFYCAKFGPWLIVLAVTGLIYPALLIFKKNIRVEPALVYSAAVILAGAAVVSFYALGMIVPWVTIRE